MIFRQKIYVIWILTGIDSEGKVLHLIVSSDEPISAHHFRLSINIL